MSGLAPSLVVKFNLEAIELPITVEDARAAALVRCLRSLTAEGTAHLTPGTFRFSTGDIITFPEDTHAEFSCEVILASEPGDGGVRIWPRIPAFSVTFSQPLEVIQQEGTPASLTAFEMGSEDSSLSNSVEVQLRDTIGLAFAKLTSQPLPESTELTDPLELVSGLEVPKLRLELAEEVQVELEGQRLHLAGGSIDVRDLRGARADARAEATAELSIRLGPDTVLTDGSGRIEGVEAELALELYATQEGNQVTLISRTERDAADGLRLSSARLVTPEGGTVEVAPSSLRLKHLSWSPEAQLQAEVEGAVAVAAVALALGPVDLEASAGRVGSMSATLADASAPDGEEVPVPSLRVQDVELEQVGLKLSGEQSLELRAERMTLPEGRSEAGHIPIRSEETELSVSDGAGHALTARSSGVMTVTLDAPQPLALGTDAPVDGLEVSAQWEKLELADAADSMVISPAGLELRVLQEDPLSLEVTVHSAQTTLGKFEQGLAESTLRVALYAKDESGVISLSTQVPYALLTETIRSELPEVVRAEVPDSFADSLTSKLKGHGGDIIKQVAGRIEAGLEISGHDKLRFESTGRGGIRVEGTIWVVAVLRAQLGRYASALRSVVPRAAVDAESGVFEVIRKGFSVPLKGGVAVETTAPALLTELQLAVRLQPDPPADPDTISGLLASILSERLSKQALKLSLRPLLQAQLPFEAERVRINSGALEAEPESIRVDIVAEHLGR